VGGCEKVIVGRYGRRRGLDCKLVARAKKAGSMELDRLSRSWGKKQAQIQKEKRAKG